MEDEKSNSELEQLMDRKVNLAIEKLKQDHENICKELVFKKTKRTDHRSTVYKALTNGKIIKESDGLAIEETIPNINMPNYISYYNPWIIQTIPKWYGITEPEKEQQKAKEEETMNYSYRDIKVSTYNNGSICIETGLDIYKTDIIKKGKTLYTEISKGKDKSVDCHSETVIMIKQRVEILKKIKNVV